MRSARCASSACETSCSRATTATSSTPPSSSFAATTEPGGSEFLPLGERPRKAEDARRDSCGSVAAIGGEAAAEAGGAVASHERERERDRLISAGAAVGQRERGGEELGLGLGE